MDVRCGEYSEKKIRSFTDREGPREVFWNRYRQMKDTMQHETCKVSVLHYYGVGGIGKTTLLKKLIAELYEQEQKPEYVHFDFEDAQDSRTVLTRMAEVMTERYHFSFPQFDIANITYAKRTNSYFNERDVQQFCQKSPFLRLGLKTLDAVTGSVATKIVEIADDALAEFRNYLQRHKNNIRKMDHIDLKELYEHLPYYFALDMQNNLKDKTKPFVIFLDTYEKLVNEISGVGNPLMNDLWLRGENGLIQRIPNVLWVIGGRNRLKWEEFDKDWQQAVEQNLLGNLSEEDSNTFLLQAGVEDCELREQLYQLTGGAPLYLDLCMDTYDDLEEKGIVPTLEMFGQTPEDLIESFIRYMDDRMQDFVYYLVCLQRFDDETVMGIAQTIFSPFPHTMYQKIKGLSFINETEQGLFGVHQTVCDVLTKRCPMPLKQKIAEAILQYFSSAKENIYEIKYGMRLTLLLRAGMLLELSREEFYQFYCKHIRPDLKEMIDGCLFEQAERISQPFYAYATAQQDDVLYVAACIDYCYFDEHKGKWKESMAQKEKVYAEAVKILGADHPETLILQGNIAIALDDFGQYEKSAEINREVWKRREIVLGEDDLYTQLAKANLAGCLYHMNQFENALQLCTEVLDNHIKNLGKDHRITLSVMGFKAKTQFRVGLREEALEAMEYVYQKRVEILGENHPETLISLYNMHMHMDMAHQTNQIVEIRERLLRLYREIYGENHPATLEMMYNVALSLEKENVDEAMAMHEEILVGRREILGEGHPDVFASRRKIAECLYKLGSRAEALEMLEEIVNRAKEALGEKHRETMFARSEFGRFLVLDRKYLKAEPVLRNMLRDCEEVFGCNDPNTLTIAKGYANALIGLKRPDKARQILKKYHLDKKR